MKNKLFIGIIFLSLLALGIGALANSKEDTLTRSYNSYGDEVSEKKLAYGQLRAKNDEIRKKLSEAEEEKRNDWAEEQEKQDDVRCELGKLKLLNLYEKNKIDFSLREVVLEYCDEPPVWFDDYNWMWDMIDGLDDSKRDAPPEAQENNLKK